jgi:hypothetical protein
METRMKPEKRIKEIKKKLLMKANALEEQYPDLKETVIASFLDRTFAILDAIDYVNYEDIDQLQLIFTDAKEKINQEINDLLMIVMKERNKK